MDDVADLADGEPPAQSPTPPVQIRLYDGQELTGRLHHRWQSSTGAWMYHVSVTLWAITQLGARDVSEPADIEFDAPSSHVRPLPGISYQGVPLTRHRDAIIRARTGRRLPDPTPPAAAQPAGAGTRWGVERERKGYDVPGPRRTRVHTSNCPVYQGPYDLTTAQALQAAAQPAASVCTMCDARELAQLGPSRAPGMPSGRTHLQAPGSGGRPAGHRPAEGSGL